MLKYIFSAVILSFTLTLSCLTEAQNQTGVTAALKYGQYQLDMPVLGVKGSDLDADKGFGITLGYYDNTDSSLELDYIKGNVIVTRGQDKINLNANSTAIFWAFRSRAQTYWIAKLGYAKTEFKQGSKKLHESFDKIAYGVGGGYKIKSTFALEAEYTFYQKEMANISFAARWVF